MANQIANEGTTYFNGVKVNLGFPSKNKETLHKGINIFPGKDGDTELITNEITKEGVSKILYELDWSDISFATVVFDEDCSIEVSGSYPDGFCSIYRKGAQILFANPPPDSVGEMENILHLFIDTPEEAIEKYDFV